MENDQQVIRLEVSLASNPPTPPIDQNTGRMPILWVGSTVAFEIGIFGRVEAAVDLSNLDFLTVAIFPSAIFNQIDPSNFRYNPYSPSPFPTLPPAPQVFVTVPASEITGMIERAEWDAGNAQQARIVFSWSQTAQLTTNGQKTAPYWLALMGFTDEGKRIVYGACPLIVYDAGLQGVYLPNTYAPLVVPEDTILYIAPNQQLPFSQPIDVEGTIVVDGGTLVQY